jgi:small-conductance mechanosensitive channel
MSYYKLLLSAFFTVVFLMTRPLIGFFFDEPEGVWAILYNRSSILVTIAFSWVLIELIRTAKIRYLRRFDISQEDNLASRKVYTQINLLEKVLIFVIAVFALGVVLLSFEGIRQIGVGLFASAGVAGIIIGLSAQKIVGALLAGIQIAITQPFRIDDAVLVENEWGWIEEINLT